MSDSDYFQGHPGIDVMPEPIDKWTNLNGTNLLSLAARDPKRWAMSEVKGISGSWYS